MNQYHSNLSYLRDRFEKGDTLTFVSSFPRSGNTWARHLLADVILQNRGFETQTELPIHPDQVIPDVHSNPVDARDARLEAEPFLVKSHDRVDQIGEHFGSAAFQRLRHLYLVRRPEDALVSYYHFHLRYEGLRSQASDGANAFCLRHLDSWLEHTRSVLTYDRLYGEMQIVSYEQLLRAPEASLASMLSWLGISANSETIARAVEHMQFANLQRKESRNPANPNEFFFRKGVAGSGRTELSAGTVEAIHRRSAEVLAAIQHVQSTADPMVLT